MKLSALTAGLALVAAMPVAAVETVYTATLNGSSEAVPNESPGIGAAIVTIDFDARTMRVQESFSDLMSPVTASHIHCCTDDPLSGATGVATMMPTFTGFPSDVTEGTYDRTFDMMDASSYSGAFLTAGGFAADGAFDALVSGLNSGTAYANIHTEDFPSGEIRGFLVPIPEPATYAMLLAGVGLISMVARRRRD